MKAYVHVRFICIGSSEIIGGCPLMVVGCGGLGGEVL